MDRSQFNDGQNRKSPENNVAMPRVVPVTELGTIVEAFQNGTIMKMQALRMDEKRQWQVQEEKKVAGVSIVPDKKGNGANLSWKRGEDLKDDNFYASTIHSKTVTLTQQQLPDGSEVLSMSWMSQRSMETRARVFIKERTPLKDGETREISLTEMAMEVDNFQKGETLKMQTMKVDKGKWVVEGDNEVAHLGLIPDSDSKKGKLSWRMGKNTTPVNYNMNTEKVTVRKEVRADGAPVLSMSWVSNRSKETRAVVLTRENKPLEVGETREVSMAQLVGIVDNFGQEPFVMQSLKGKKDAVGVFAWEKQKEYPASSLVCTSHIGENTGKATTELKWVNQEVEANGEDGRSSIFLNGEKATVQRVQQDGKEMLSIVTASKSEPGLSRARVLIRDIA